MDDVSLALWEGLAEQALESAGMNDGQPVDTFMLAKALGFTVLAAHGLTWCRPDGNRIYVRAGARLQIQQAGVAHELGHAILLTAKETDSEAAAWHVGAALLLPRRAMRAAVAAHGWHLEELARWHPRASFEIIVRRLVGLYQGAATIVDNGRVTKRLVSPGLHGLERPHRAELRLARRAVAVGTPVEEGPYRAVPVCESGWERVVIVRPWWD